MKLTWRIWVLIIALILAFLTIAPWGFLEKGALIKSVKELVCFYLWFKTGHDNSKCKWQFSD